MKNIIISAASILIVAATASAQTDLMATAHPNARTSLLTGIGTTANVHFVRENRRAFKSWSTMYRDVTNVEPSELKDKTVVFAWNEKGARYRAFFTGGGVWLHTVISYEEGLLPASVKNLVRSTYYDLRISYVDEVQTPGQTTVYRVQLQDDKKLVIVKVAGDEMEKVAEYQK